MSQTPKTEKTEKTEKTVGSPTWNNQQNLQYGTVDLDSLNKELEEKYRRSIEAVVFDYLRENLEMSIDSQYGGNERWVQVHLTKPSTGERKLVSEASFSVHNCPD
jgi:hypothetical protein